MPFQLSPSIWVALFGGLGILATWRVSAAVSARRRARRQLFGSQTRDAGDEVTRSVAEPWSSSLERWLYVSGFRRTDAVATYLVLQGAALTVGVVLSLVIVRSPVLDTGVQWLREIPGGVGDFLAPILAGAPWIVFFWIGLLPVAIVRSRRRDIVLSVERDLPMTLALLATLVESGMGFDAAVQRILGSLDTERPLARELQQFRSQSRSGVPRATCFRALSARLDIMSVSTFVSAMVHSEQVGGGVAESLRRQADEVWSRRRELAIQRAQTLPTKLAVPLVVCFLPGIFVYTFGPALAQFLRIADSVVTGG